MLPTKLTAAVLAVSIAILPASRVAADGRDFLAGAVLGGVAGALIQKQVQTQKQQRLRAKAATPQVYAAQPTRVTPKKTYRPSIPATTEGREIQSSLTYFGFDTGSIDGRVGPATRSAISDYQRYMGYEATGTLTSFQQHLLTNSYLRAEAGGERTLGLIAGLPDGTRGLLKVYREELATGATQPHGTRVEPSSLAAGDGTIDL